ncbi:major facilitator superfamily transporter [Niveomyces insectorum RCEF 264]|uniref:Major facilitator superfamily transporter n=1 Tax=Niveomyces insectorum RCEF 264 TaxID=1081102 RepID=A0A167YL92_9HYPO|nr:major facilitator superfamily transporter [Niveomyces insectorum RCEF 264]
MAAAVGGAALPSLVLTAEAPVAGGRMGRTGLSAPATEAGTASRTTAHEKPARQSATPLHLGSENNNNDDHDDDDDDNDGNVSLAALPAAYALEWAPDAPCARTTLDVGVAGHGDVSQRADALCAAWHLDANASAAAVASQPASAKSRCRRLFVLRDADDEDVNRALCSALDVDPAFLAAHTAHQRYQPKEQPWRARNNSAVGPTAYTYPQMLTVLKAGAPVASDVGTLGRVQADQEPEIPQGERNVVVVGSPPASFVVGMAANKIEDAGGARPGQDRHAERTGIATAPASPSGPRSRRRLKKEKDPVAVFCRASLWTGPRAHVLFLNSCPSSTALEDALPDALDDAAAAVLDGAVSEGSTVAVATAAHLRSAVARLACDQWMDLFDALGSSSSPNRNNINKRLFWDMAQYLERNLAVARDEEKKNHRRRQCAPLPQMHANEHGASTHPRGRSPLPSSSAFEDLAATTSEDWRALLSRLERLVALLPLWQQQSPHRINRTRRTAWRSVGPRTPFTVNRVVTSEFPEATARSPAADGIPTSVAPSASPGSRLPGPSFSATPEGQDALSRVTYMGGILLPFSIVASILSIQEPFGPTNRLFWVFWVVTIPSTILSLIIIYADEIRSKYVWAPMSRQSFQDAVKRGETLPVEAAVAAAAEAEAAEPSTEKPESELESDVETEPVVGALRFSDRSGHHKANVVRVDTGSSPGSKPTTYYRLSKPLETNQTPSRPAGAGAVWRKSTAAAMGRPASAEGGSAPVSAGIASARMRRRRRIPNPFSWVASSGGRSSNAPLPVVSNTAASLDSGDKDSVIIHMGNPEDGAGLGDAVEGPLITSMPGCPVIVVQPWADGSQLGAWRRQRLGWAGAVKSIVGYQRAQNA